MSRDVVPSMVPPDDHLRAAVPTAPIRSGAVPGAFPWRSGRVASLLQQGVAEFVRNIFAWMVSRIVKEVLPCSLKVCVGSGEYVGRRVAEVAANPMGLLPSGERRDCREDWALRSGTGNKCRVGGGVQRSGG